MISVEHDSGYSSLMRVLTRTQLQQAGIDLVMKGAPMIVVILLAAVAAAVVAVVALLFAPAPRKYSGVDQLRQPGVDRLRQLEDGFWGNRRGFFEGLQSGLGAARRRRAAGISPMKSDEATTEEERTTAFYDGLQNYADHS